MRQKGVQAARELRYMDSFMASNRPCYMITWIIYKNQLLEVDPTQIALQGVGVGLHWTLSSPLLSCGMLCFVFATIHLSLLELITYINMYCKSSILG